MKFLCMYDKSFLIRLGISIWLVLLVHFNSELANQRFSLLCSSLVEKQTVDFTNFSSDWKYNQDVMEYNHKFLIVGNPGMAFLAAPVWTVVYYGFYRWVPVSSAVTDSRVHALLVFFFSVASTSAFLVTLTALGIGWLVMAKTQSTWRALLGVFLYAFGSIAFFHAATLSQNTAVAFCAFFIFVLLFFQEVDTLINASWRLGLVGFLMGLSLLFDFSALPLIILLIPVFFQELSKANWRNRFVSLICFLIPVVMLMVYLKISWGNWFIPPQMYMPGDLTIENHLKLPNIMLLVDYLFGFQRGFFMYMPYALLFPGYLILKRYRSMLTDIQRRMIGWYCIISLFFISIIWSAQFHIFGPRYLLSLVPFVCFLVSLCLRISWFNLSLIAAGFLINIAGVTITSWSQSPFLTVFLYLLRGHWFAILDWVGQYSERIFKVSPQMLSPTGIFVSLSVCLLIIWLPYWIRLQAKRESNS